MDLIKAIVCDDIYNTIEEYLNQVVVFDIIDSKVEPNWNNFINYKISIDVDLLIYLDSINSSCITYTGRRYPIMKGIIRNFDEVIVKIFYKGKIFHIKRKRDVRTNKQYSSYLYNYTQEHIVRIMDPIKNYAIDFKNNNSSVLHPDIIDYYCNSTQQIDNELKIQKSTIFNGQIEMYFCVGSH